MDGRKALYMCKDVPAIGEGIIKPEIGDELMIGSFLSPAEVPAVMEEVHPALTVVDPINGWVDCSAMCPGIRSLNMALYRIFTAAEMVKSEIIFIGDIINRGGNSSQGILDRSKDTVMWSSS
jgi:hypothetical protein